MIRTLVAMLALLAVSAACPAWGAAKAAKPRAKPLPMPTVVAVLARAGVAGETVELRDLVDAPEPAADDFSAARATIRACHAERYAAARDNVQSGRSAPLRAC